MASHCLYPFATVGAIHTMKKHLTCPVCSISYGLSTGLTVLRRIFMTVIHRAQSDIHSSTAPTIGGIEAGATMTSTILATSCFTLCNQHMLRLGHAVMIGNPTAVVVGVVIHHRRRSVHRLRGGFWGNHRPKRYRRLLCGHRLWSGRCHRFLCRICSG